MPDTALEDINVLDLTHHIAGPYCTKLLADFGARVIKVERPGFGDGARAMGPFFHDQPHSEKSLPFLYLNTNKLGVTLNLKTDTGAGILKELIRDADLLVESFSPRAMRSLGLDYQTLRKVNPRLVMVSISNFGQAGPYRDYKAADIVEYAMGGLMYIFGAYDREPLKHALNQAQFKAGTNAAGAALIALYHQRATGEGQHVDISIQEGIASTIRDTTSQYTYMGAVRRRLPRYSGGLARVMPVKDGYIVPVMYGGVEWETFANFLDAPELNDPRFATQEGRILHAQELEGLLNRHLGQRDKFQVFHQAHQWRFIFGVVQTPEEVASNPQYKERGYFVEIDHPVVGRATYPGAPFLMSQTPWRVRSPAPTLGQHNEDVFCGRLGYSKENLVRLRALGIV